LVRTDSFLKIGAQSQLGKSKSRVAGGVDIGGTSGQTPDMDEQPDHSEDDPESMAVDSDPIEKLSQLTLDILVRQVRSLVGTEIETPSRQQFIGYLRIFPRLLAIKLKAQTSKEFASAAKSCKVGRTNANAVIQFRLYEPAKIAQIIREHVEAAYDAADHGDIYLYPSLSGIIEKYGRADARKGGKGGGKRRRRRDGGSAEDAAIIAALHDKLGQVEREFTVARQQIRSLEMERNDMAEANQKLQAKLDDALDEIRNLKVRLRQRISKIKSLVAVEVFRENKTWLS
jgi:hypothetical protein